MSYCGKCGTELAPNAKFCKKCGTPVPSTDEATNETMPVQEQAVEQPLTQEETESVIPEENVAPTQVAANNYTTQGNEIPPNTQFPSFIEKLKSNKKLVAIVAAVVVVLIAGIAFVNNVKKTVDLNKCLTVEFTGADTYGHVSAYIDSNKYIAAVQKASGKKVDFDDGYSLNDLSNSFSYASLLDSITVDVSPNEALSNGDKVKITISYDKSIAKSLDIKIKAKDEKVTVKDLKEAEVVDPFEDVKVEFSGISPNASAQVTNTSKKSFLSSLHYEADPSEGLKVGDEVTVTVTVDEDQAAQAGYAFKETSKTYKCEKVDSYVETYEDISEDALTSMQKEATDEIESYFATKTDYLSNDGLTFVGTYILSAKSSSWSSENIVYLVYSTTVTSVEGEFSPTVTYIPVEFDALLEKADGGQTFDLDPYMVSGHSNLEYSWSDVYGYTDGATMFSDLVVSEKSDYTYDVSDGLKQFGE